MGGRFRWRGTALVIAIVLGVGAARAWGQATTTTGESAPAVPFPPGSLEQFAASTLPPELAEGLYVKLWAWGSYLNVREGDPHSIGDGQISLDVTKSFQGRFAVTVEMSVLAAENHWRGQLEQAYFSMLPFEDNQTIVTVGKFHAGIGAEGRDFWSRFGGTTSLLFSAEPQDLIGGMVTVPVGSTNLTLKPFITSAFAGHRQMEGGPAGGLIVQYKPVPTVALSLTNWVGPGFEMGDDDEEDDSADEYGGAAAIENWQGPNIHGERAGTLYFVDGTVKWTPRNDLTIAAEALLGTTRGAEGASGWQGCMVLANFDVTDQWRVFGRWSYLNDAGVITGTAQRRQELSAGVAYAITTHLEVRGEYRYDFSTTTGDESSFSLHVVFGY